MWVRTTVRCQNRAQRGLLPCTRLYIKFPWWMVQCNALADGECDCVRCKRLPCCFYLGPGKTRTHCGGNMACVLRCCPSVAKCGNIVARRADTWNVSETFQKHFFCPGHTICVCHKRRARGKTSHHLEHMITSAMLPPQCVLVLRRSYTKIVYYRATAITQSKSLKSEVSPTDGSFPGN